MRSFLGIAIAVGLSAFVVGCHGRAAGPADRILLVTIDTLRADHLGYAGHDVETPNLDALGRAGAIFTDAVTAAPLTLPSHSTILTGLYPTHHRTRNNGTFHLPDEMETVAEMLKGAGYRTGAFVGAFVLDSRFGLAQGFDHYDDELPEENPISKNFYAERRAEEVVQRALSWIQERHDPKLFVWVHVFDCHAPYDPPPPFHDRYSDRPYDGEIAYTDSTLGPLLQAFDPSQGGAVIVTADHGESLGEHGEATHALFIYDSTTRVPLIVRAASVPEGTRIDAEVRTADITPTILELAGIAPEADLDGKSLLPLVRGEETESRRAYTESLAPFFNFNWAKLRSLRDGRYKLIDAPRRELYDLDSDPKEEKNLWSADAPREARDLLAEVQRIEAQDKASPDLTRPVDAATARRLESLGYVSSSAPPRPGGSNLPDPKDRVEVYEHLQGILSRTDLEPDELISEYRKVLKLEPENTWARIRLAIVLAEQKRYEEAIVEFRALIGVAAMDTRAYENLGVALLLLDRVDEALDVTQKAVDSSPWDPALHVLRGEALERAHRPQEALASYERAIAIEPEDAENYWRRGAVLQKLGKIDEAEKALRKAVAMNPALEPATLALARILTQTGRTDEALRLLQPASSEGAIPAGRKAGIAEVELAEGREDEALRLLEEARNEAPDDTRVLALLGPIYARRGELAKATATLEHARALGETSPDVRRNLALMYQQTGKLPAAIEELRAASRDAPDDASIWFSLGNAYLKSGRFRDAELALEKCVSLEPTREQALFNLAVLYEKRGERAKAVASFRKFLETGVPDERRRSLAEKRIAELTSSKP